METNSFSPDFFKKKYDTQLFLQFLQFFLGDGLSVAESDFNDTDSYKTIKDAKRIATHDNLNLSIIEVTHNTKDARVSIARDAFSLMADHNIDRALIIFKNESPNYRFSLLTIELDEDKSGKVKRIYSNPRRYSFFLGKDAKVNTPYRQLIKKGRVKNFDDLKDRFSLEVVNKEFYKTLVSFFNRLVGSQKTEPELTLPNDDARQREHFTVRLIGRIIFVWFLKQKKSKEGSLVPDEILSSQAVNDKNYFGGYYHDVLERLFFELLNTPKDKRNIVGKPYDAVPYLNGGLFAAHENDYYRLNHQTGYSEYLNILKIPDPWFREFFEFLETYNFTIDENTSFDQELSIDPEMLGRIFENLLAELNEDTGESARKATGSFYTPREIVDYMVDESLESYFLETTHIGREKIKALISYGREDDELYPLNEDEKKKVVEAIAKIKILDPACGSGAFPIGILQKLIYILSIVDEDGLEWRNYQLSQTPVIYRQKVEQEFARRTKDYLRKLEIIKNSIFGVDIQPIAVEVSRLRAFLTLIVEEEIDDSDTENRGIEPLPNLEFKFVSANTLIPLPETKNQNLFDDEKGIKELAEVMTEYFSSSEKESIKLRFQQVQKRILQHMIKIRHDAELTHKLATWDPFSDESVGWFDPKWMFGVEDGFDIVIGNPPYISFNKSGNKPISRLYKDLHYKTFDGNGDIYTLFYERGVELLKEGGYLTYITSNKWMRADYGKKLRSFFLSKNPLKLLDLGEGVFESATVDTNILILQNTENKNQLEACKFGKDYKKGDDIAEYFEKHKIKLDKEDLKDDVWFIGTKEEIAIKKKIEKVGTPLKDWDVEINYGIKTGFNQAFIIDIETKEKLIKEDPKSVEIIKPILRGRDIGRYYADFAGKWLIATHNGYTDEKGNKIPKIDINDYPAVKKWLDKFYKKLEKRYDQGDTPYNLRDCAYWPKFEQEKIVWQEIIRTPQFTYDEGEYYVEATAFVMTGEHLKYLLGLLNSTPVFYFFKMFYAGGGLGSTGIRYKKTFIKKLPIPQITPQNKHLAEQIENLVDQILQRKKQDKRADTKHLEAQIDELVFELYGLSEDERRVIGY